MGSHDLFGHLKHKLWSKEGPKVKLSIWLPTTKSRESPRFPCVKVACQIPLKSSRWKLQICFRPHLNWSFAHKIMGVQSCGSPNVGNFGTPLASFGTKWHLGVGSWPCIKNTIRGKVVASPKSGPWWVLWVQVCLCLVHAPKVFQLHINQLVIWFV